MHPLATRDGRGELRDGSIETDIVLGCIRRHFGNSRVRKDIEILDRDCDRILSVAEYHGVVPLVCASLAHHRIEGEFRRWAANGLLYGHELARVHNHLSGHRVRAIAFKGPTLAMRAYGHLWQRQVRDLDLLVARADIEKAFKLLCGLGYRVDAAYSGRDEVTRTDKHLLLVDEGTGTKVEIHWAISLPGLHFDLPFEQLWERRDYISVSGTPIPTPCLDDLLLILSVHGASHFWTSLKWVCDIAALIHGYSDAEWRALQAEATKQGCARMLLLAVTLARNVSGVPLPPAAEQESERDATVGALAREAQERFSKMDRLDFFDRLFTNIRSRERFIDRARIAGSYLWSVLTRDNYQPQRPPTVPNSVSWPKRVYGIRLRSWNKLPSLLAAVMDHGQRRSWS